MAIINTVSATTQTRDQALGVPVGNIDGEVDLSQIPDWAFFSTFVENGLEITNYDPSSPSVDIGAGRVARKKDSGQSVIKVEAESSVSIGSGVVNYLFFREDDVIEVQDGDNPPGSGAVLFAKVDTTDDSVDTDVRGRSPIPSQILDQLVEDRTLSIVDIESQDMDDATSRSTRIRISASETLALLRAGVISDALASQTDLSAEVISESGSTTEHLTEAKRVTGDPLVSIDGPEDIRFEVSNDTGGQENGVSATWGFEILTNELDITLDLTGWYRGRKDNDNTATVSNNGPINSANQKWSVALDDSVVRGFSVVDNVIYTKIGTIVYSLDPVDGSTNWSTDVGSGTIFVGQRVANSPTIADGYAYVNGGDKIHALDITNNGSVEWTYTLSGTDSVIGSPAVDYGSVYFSTIQGAESISRSDGSEEWAFSTAESPNGPVALSGGDVYVNAPNDALYCLTSQGGTEEWSYTNGSGSATTPVVDGDVIYMSNPEPTAVDSGDGSEVWRVTSDFTGDMGCAVDATNVYYVVDFGDHVIALDKSDGNENWRFTASGQTFKAPSVAGSRVYITAEGGEFRALDASNGNEDWSITGISGNIQAPSTVVDSLGLIGNTGGDVFAYE
jgi:outer membrane protein assembly factor BamB